MTLTTDELRDLEPPLLHDWSLEWDGDDHSGPRCARCDKVVCKFCEKGWEAQTDCTRWRRTALGWPLPPTRFSPARCT